MRPFKKITIIGVGLIGGSLGLAIRKRKLAFEVVGFFRHKGKIPAAVRKGCVDSGTGDLAKAVRGSDLVILCSPVGDIIKKLGLLKKFIGKKPLVTDAGSAKTKIVRAAKGLNFIGSHPLAGSEQSGLSFAAEDLFKGAFCVLTPTGAEPRHSLKRLERFWKSLGAKTVVMRPEAHDRILGFTSHMPHAVAFSLMNAIPRNMLRFSAGGLKDTTRIAGSSPELWADIFLSNRREVVRSLAVFERSLAGLKKSLLRDDRKKLLSLLKSSGKKREGLSTRS